MNKLYVSWPAVGQKSKEGENKFSGYVEGYVVLNDVAYAVVQDKNDNRLITIRLSELRVER